MGEGALCLRAFGPTLTSRPTSLEQPPPPEFLLEATPRLRALLVEDSRLPNGRRYGLVDAPLHGPGLFAGAQVHPADGGQVDLDRPLAGVEYRRYHEVRADHKLVFENVHLRVVGVVDKGVPDDGEAGLGGHFDELHPVRFPGRVDLREAGEMPEGLFVGVDLVVNLGSVALVGAEHYREGGEFRPAHEQLLCTMVLEKRAVYRGVAADIRVLKGVAGEPAREQACHGAPYAIVLVPAHNLILFVPIDQDSSILPSLFTRACSPMSL